MDLILQVLSERDARQDSVFPPTCSVHVSRLLSALAVAGSLSAQEFLSNVIADQRVFEVAPEVKEMAFSCATKAIEATHRIVNPSERLFDTIYSLASQLGDPVKQTRVSTAAMLALGSLGRANRKFAGTSRTSILSVKASKLLQQKFREALEFDVTRDGLYQESQIQMAEAFRGASSGMQNHLMASIRSLNRLEATHLLRAYPHIRYQGF